MILNRRAWSARSCAFAKGVFSSAFDHSRASEKGLRGHLVFRGQTLAPEE